jgi:hypothetical protein
MDSAKVMEKIHEVAANRYVHNLISTKLKKITLFTIFPHTAAPNISEGVSFLLVEDLMKIASLLGANVQN